MGGDGRGWAGMGGDGRGWAGMWGWVGMGGDGWGWAGTGGDGWGWVGMGGDGWGWVGRSKPKVQISSISDPSVPHQYGVNGFWQLKPKNGSLVDQWERVPL